jgi:hypothetical protein
VGSGVTHRRRLSVLILHSEDYLPAVVRRCLASCRSLSAFVRQSNLQGASLNSAVLEGAWFYFDKPDLVRGRLLERSRMALYAVIPPP